MKYRQLDEEEWSAGGVANGGSGTGADRAGPRAASQTGWQELKRNVAPHDGRYRAQSVQQWAPARRYRSRRNRQFGRTPWERVEELLREERNPEQVSEHLRRKRELAISHETIYRHIWADLRGGGSLHEHLPGARKHCRKRYGRSDSRGRLAGKK